MELVLRPWTDADADALNAAIAASRDHLRPFMAWADEALTATQRRAWFTASADAGHRLFGAWERGALVGSVGLHPRIGPGGLEIGYWVHADHVRRGIATELARRACAIAFADPSVTHVQIHHDTHNPASGRVAQALGFTLVGEVPSPAVVPAGSGTDRVWRLERPSP